MTTKKDYERIPPFPMNTSAYGRCKRCKEIDILNHRDMCADCDHVTRLQGFANAIANLGTGGTADEREMILQQIYESALPLVRE